MKNHTHKFIVHIMRCLLLFFAAHQLQAQSYLGGHIGLNLGKFSGDSPPEFVYKGKMQYNAGLVFDLFLKDDIFLSVAPSYFVAASNLQYPYRDEEDEVAYRDSVALKGQFLALPVNLKVLSENKRFQFSGGLELALPVMLTANDGVEEVDITGAVNRLALNMIFGLGYRIPIDRNILFINLGYSQGLTNLANNQSRNDSYLPRIRMTSFRLSAAWLLPLGKGKK